MKITINALSRVIRQNLDKTKRKHLLQYFKNSTGTNFIRFPSTNKSISSICWEIPTEKQSNARNCLRMNSALVWKSKISVGCKVCQCITCNRFFLCHAGKNFSKMTDGSKYSFSWISRTRLISLVIHRQTSRNGQLSKKRRLKSSRLQEIISGWILFLFGNDSNQRS